MSDSGEEYQLYDFTIVQFVHRGKKRKVEQIDVVPSKWLTFNKQKGRCQTPFMGGNIEGEDMRLLHDLVKNLADPPQDWNFFTVDVKGRAKTYDEALLEVERLGSEECVLTIESGDETFSDVQKRLCASVKQQQLLRQSQKLKETLRDAGNSNSQKRKSAAALHEPSHLAEKRKLISSPLALPSTSKDTIEVIEAEAGSNATDQQSSPSEYMDPLCTVVQKNSEAVKSHSEVVEPTPVVIKSQPVVNTQGKLDLKYTC